MLNNQAILETLPTSWTAFATTEDGEHCVMFDPEEMEGRVSVIGGEERAGLEVEEIVKLILDKFGVRIQIHGWEWGEADYESVGFFEILPNAPQ